MFSILSFPDSDYSTGFEIAGRESAKAFLNTSQIGAKLANKAKLNIIDGMVMMLGKALKKHGYLWFIQKEVMCMQLGN